MFWKAGRVINCRQNFIISFFSNNVNLQWCSWVRNGMWGLQLWDILTLKERCKPHFTIFLSWHPCARAESAGWEVRIGQNCDRGLENAAFAEVLKMHFQARGVRFSLYGPTLSRLITFLSFSSCRKLAYKWATSREENATEIDSVFT